MVPVVSSFLYGPGVQEALLSAKNSGRRDVLRQMANEMAPAVARVCQHTNFDVVTWVPSSRVRRRQRGYDQGEVIAKKVGRCLGIKARRLLVRTAQGDSCQLGQTRLQRLEGPELIAPTKVPSCILVVDDVVTTGASLDAASRALKERGASQLVAATIASVETQEHLNLNE